MPPPTPSRGPTPRGSWHRVRPSMGTRHRKARAIAARTPRAPRGAATKRHDVVYQGQARRARSRRARTILRRLSKGPKPPCPQAQTRTHAEQVATNRNPAPGPVGSSIDSPPRSRLTKSRFAPPMGGVRVNSVVTSAAAEQRASVGRRTGLRRVGCNGGVVAMPHADLYSIGGFQRL